MAGAGAAVRPDAGAGTGAEISRADSGRGSAAAEEASQGQRRKGPRNLYRCRDQRGAGFPCGRQGAASDSAAEAAEEQVRQSQQKRGATGQRAGTAAAVPWPTGCREPYFIRTATGHCQRKSVIAVAYSAALTTFAP